MKKLLVLLTILLAVPFLALAEPDVEPDEEAQEEFRCPATQMSDSCLKCHKVVFDKENNYKWSVDRKKVFDPPFGVTMTEADDGTISAHYKLEDIEDNKIFTIYEWLNKHDIKDFTIEIHSPGGSVPDALRIIAIIQQNPHITTTTRVDGWAASAGFLLLTAGSPGHRIASPRAMLMAHELRTWTFLKQHTPSSTKDDAEMMEIWQTNLNEWLAERSHLTVDQIKNRTHYKDWWFTGEKAQQLGFVDTLMWENTISTMDELCDVEVKKRN